MDKFFENCKVVDFQKLLGYGFENEGGKYIYRAPICDGEMIFCFTVDGDNTLWEVRDGDTGEVYTLHLDENASGEYVGRVRSECGKILEDIAQKCFDKEVFRCKYSRDIIHYAKEKYGDEEEYLWEKFPDNAVLRRKDSKKWYAAILTAPRSAFFKGEEGSCEVINMRIDADEPDKLADGKRYFRAWHMNKKHWLTMLTDGSVPLEEILLRLDVSYGMAGKP